MLPTSQITPASPHRTRKGSFTRADEQPESPLRRARRIRFSPEFATFSASTQKHLRRVADVTKLTAPIAELLDRDAAPFLVCRWIAWGHWMQDRVVRLALVLLLREEARLDAPGRSRTGWAWPDDKLFVTAEKIFWQSPQAARLVKVGIFVQHGQVPAQGGPLFTTMWDKTWTLVQDEFSTINRDTFLAEVNAIVAQRRRRRARKRLRLGEREIAYLSALDTIKRGLIKGDITLEDALQHQPTPKRSK